MSKHLIGTATAALLWAAAVTGAAAQDGAVSGVGTGGWGGFYVGVLAGSSDSSFYWNEADGLGDFDGSLDSTSVGLFGGYNVQRDRLVYGVEAQVSVFNGDAAFTGVPGPDDVDASLDRQVAIRGRLGFDQGKVMPYVAAGYSWTSMDTEAIGVGPASGTHQAFVAAVGADFALTNRLFGRIEVAHAFPAEERYVYCAPNCVADIELGGTSVQLGVGLRF